MCGLYLLDVNAGCRTEIKQGAEILAEKIRKYRPKIAVFNGKGRWISFSCVTLHYLLGNLSNLTSLYKFI